jgi:hypothetical protein
VSLPEFSLTLHRKVKVIEGHRLQQTLQWRNPENRCEWQELTWCVVSGRASPRIGFSFSQFPVVLKPQLPSCLSQALPLA